MKERAKIIIIIIFLLILSLIFNFFTTEKIYYSENEFRYLETIQPISFNSIIKRKTFSNVEKFIEDHFPYREDFIKLKNNFELSLGKKLINNVYITDNYFIEKYKGLEKKDELIEVLNNFYQNNKDVDINLMLVPTSFQINSEELGEYYHNNKQKQDIKYIYDNIKLNNIDIYNSLNNSNKKKELFYKTDHHWTTYGAYEAYKTYAKIKNLEIKEIELIKITGDFKGSIYSKVLLDTFKDDIYIYETSSNLNVSYYKENNIIQKNTLYNMEYLDKKDKYSLFLDNNNPLLVIENKEIRNKNNILVIKDSYANSFIPFLTDNYHTIHVIDPRYYLLSISEYIKENNIKEVLFLYNINTLDNDTGIYRIK